jgi:hypothetical protein
MRPELAQALQMVMADVRALDAPEPAVEDDDWAPDPGVASAMLRWDDGTGCGVHVCVGHPLSEHLVRLADQVQDEIVEQLCAERRPAVWPECPDHPDSHPLAPTLLDGAATWVCPRGGRPIGRIGGLVGSPPRS